MMRNKAIRNTHPTVVSINAGTDAWDKDDNVVVLDESAIAIEQAKLQAEYDALQYQRDREPDYPRLAEQFDLLWHAIDADTLDKTSDFYTTLKAVKDAHPKG
jgi:hypothetical protein